MSCDLKIKDVITRWDSTHTMLERIVEQQRAILLANVGFKHVLPDFHLLTEILAVKRN
jgi:hypothetical protein